MTIYDTIIFRRTIRKFKQTAIPIDILKKLVNAGRLAPSAGNLQPLEYFIITDKSVKEKTFTTLNWAFYIKPAGNPQKGEEPAAYILVLVNNKIANKAFVKYDIGASVENIIISALEEGIGCCWIASFNKNELSKILKVSEDCSIDCVIALGYPLEKPAFEDIEKDVSIKYHKDLEGKLHVPKRKLEDIIHIEKF